MSTQLSANPFESSRPVAKSAGNALADAESQRAIAEVQAAMAIAKRFPRDPIVAMDKILNACTRPTLAETAVYTYSRGGADISGPSIRLAETLAQSWGNLQYGIRELSQQNGESTVEAFAWDVETNTKQVKIFQVPHVRYSRASGNKRLEDPRDIYELIANNGARRLRACILGVIPGDVVEAAVHQCDVTLKATADTSAEGIQKIITAFEGFGVSKAQIEKRIQRRMDSIQPAQVVSLKKIYSSLRDGMSSASDWFEVIEQAADSDDKPKTTADAIKDKVRNKPQAPSKTPDPVAASPEEPKGYQPTAEEMVEIAAREQAQSEAEERARYGDPEPKPVQQATSRRSRNGGNQSAMPLE